MTADTMNEPQQYVNISSNERNPKLSAKNMSDLTLARRSVKKAALMEMIAQEMVTSLLGKQEGFDDAEEDDAILQKLLEKLSKRSKRLKTNRHSSNKRRENEKEMICSPNESPVKEKAQLANMSYSQTVGQDIIPSAELKEYEMNIKVDDDDDSFANGCLHDLVCTSHRSVSSRSRGSKTSSAATSLSTSTGSTSADSGLELEKIRKFILSNIPQAVREQIPEAAWREIFMGHGESEGSSKQSRASGSCDSRQRKNKAKETPVASVVVDGTVEGGEERSKVDEDLKVDDDLSVMSEITGFTTVFPDGKRIETKLEAMTDLSTELFGGTTPEELSIVPSIESKQPSIVADNIVAAKSPNDPTKKRVRFSNVTLRYYERIPSDNPSVQDGPAIGIGWRFKRGGKFEVDEFEQGRGASRKSDELVLSRHEREKVLKDAGFPQKEVADMVRNILKTKNQRRQTVNNLGAQGIEEAIEKARKRVGRLLNFGKKNEILR